MYLKIKTPDVDVDITFEGTEMPKGDHFTFVASLLEKLGVAVPELEDYLDSEWPKADLDPDGWATFVVDIIQSMQGVKRDEAVRAFAKEMNRRAVTVDRPTRVRGGDWVPTTGSVGPHECVYIGKPSMCGTCGEPEPVVEIQTATGPYGDTWKADAEGDAVCDKCGRDNRNGTHDALQKTGHLDHDFVTAEQLAVMEQDGRM